ncbi:MAG: FRG domain-containing protein [Dysgonamonadaceae bacterium]
MNMENAYITTELENWNDLFLLNQRFTSKFIFRGQANSEWKLQTSLERLINKLHQKDIDINTPVSYERMMIEEFKWKYPLYGKDNISLQKDEDVEWLALMQHYGCPTRMLDFSNSLFVALFMAIDNYSFDSSSVWALNKVAIGHEIFTKYCTDNKRNYASVKQLNEYAYKRANSAIRGVTPSTIGNKELYIIEPKNCNERLNRQQGLFVIPGSIYSSFEENLFSRNLDKKELSIKELIENSNNDKNTLGSQEIFLIKINIRKELNFAINQSLKQMNITAETLYPGLDGLARSMSYPRSPLNDYKY